MSVLYLLPFLRYSTSNNGVTLTCGYGSFKVIENRAVREYVRHTIDLIL